MLVRILSEEEFAEEYIKMYVKHVFDFGDEWRKKIHEPVLKGWEEFINKHMEEKGGSKVKGREGR